MARCGQNTTEETKAEGWGDAWTWIAMDADTKLIPCWFVGGRDAGSAYHFMHDLAPRSALAWVPAVVLLRPGTAF